MSCISVFFHCDTSIFLIPHVQEVASKLQMLKEKLVLGEFGALVEIREIILQLAAPRVLVKLLHLLAGIRFTTIHFSKKKVLLEYIDRNVKEKVGSS